jgi:glycine/D-amino acid oxidase-like deaminating enzyme
LTKVLILGQGIAGTLLAFSLIDSGCSITIADPGHPDTSSRVAGGMLHPVTGRNLVKSWKADELIPFAMHAYRQLEKLLGVKFFNLSATLELYKDVAHRNEWNNKSADPSYANYIGTECKPQDVPSGIRKGIGGRWLQNGGWINPVVFLGSARSYLEVNQNLVTEEIAEENIRFTENKAEWAGNIYDYVIDCRGSESGNGKWFSWLPFNPAKGELLEFDSPGLSLECVVHKSVKIIPNGNKFLCGATYSWHELDYQPTAKAKDELEKKLRGVLELPYTVTGQRAGIRPATKDRRPFTGRHPIYPNLIIFNGLGSKGFMLAPWLAAELSAFILEGKPLPQETDISRFRFQEVN